jgi:NMD protein affecting ribosome stability and mRNA decay
MSKIEEIFHISTSLEQQMCNSCKKISPEYHELKLQLRFSYFENIDEIKIESLNKIKKNINTINKIEELNNGFDIFIRNKKEINKIPSLFNKNYLIEEKRTKKIVGRNFLESKDIWRHVLLINIINLKRNDDVIIKGNEYIISSINKNDLVLKNKSNGNKKVISYKLIKDYILKK